MGHDENRDWQKIAIEYKNEITNLWNDMLTVSAILEGSMNPRDLQKAQSILDRGVDSSEGAVGDIERFN